jgi:hypothetical protein
MNDTTKPALPEPDGYATEVGPDGAAYDEAFWYEETVHAYADQCTAAAQARIAELDGLLSCAAEWIRSSDHGDNCFVSDHYEGDPGNRCNCGKDSLLNHLESLDAAIASTSGAEPTALEDTPCPGCNGPRSAGPCCEDCSWQDKPRAASPPVVQPEAVAHCALTASGKIAHFDGKPMVMVGPVGNEHHPVPLFASPPSAELKTLSDEEIKQIGRESVARWIEIEAGTQLHDFARAIERALAEKNGASNDS